MSDITQPLVIHLDGITAHDYLAWVRDPEPKALGGQLREIRVSTDSLGDHVHAELVWAGCPPCAPRDAAAMSGFHLTPEVVSVSESLGSRVGAAADEPRASWPEPDLATATV